MNKKTNHSGYISLAFVMLTGPIRDFQWATAL